MNKKYAFSDIHGIWDLWEQIKNYCDKTDTIYFLGDAIDRGPDGIKIIQDMMKDERVIFIKGNHEDFLIQYYNRINKKILNSFNWELNNFINYWYINGGELTKKEFDKLTKDKQIAIIKYIKEAPLSQNFINKKNKKIFLSHAGTDPNYEDWEINFIMKKNQESLLWDREHFKKPYSGYQEYIIHGHTPCPLLRAILKDLTFSSTEPSFSNTIYTYAENHKIDLDIYSIKTKRTALFDLDSFEVKYFQER